ncbi:Protein NSP-INTERACTING KINASE 2, partial [Cucurbita argyrosperma subsp. argyrosperma]
MDHVCASNEDSVEKWSLRVTLDSSDEGNVGIDSCYKWCQSKHTSFGVTAEDASPGVDCEDPHIDWRGNEGILIRAVGFWTRTSLAVIKRPDGSCLNERPIGRPLGGWIVRSHISWGADEHSFKGVGEWNQPCSADWIQALMGIKAGFEDLRGAPSQKPFSLREHDRPFHASIGNFDKPLQVFAIAIFQTNYIQEQLSLNPSIGKIPKVSAHFSIFQTTCFLVKFLALFSNLKSLQYLRLNNNTFSGTIPSSLANMNQLALLDLSYNNLSGPLPRLLAKTYNFTGNSLICAPGSKERWLLVDRSVVRDYCLRFGIHGGNIDSTAQDEKTVGLPPPSSASKGGSKLSVGTVNARCSLACTVCSHGQHIMRLEGRTLYCVLKDGGRQAMRCAQAECPRGRRLCDGPSTYRSSGVLGVSVEYISPRIHWCSCVAGGPRRRPGRGAGYVRFGSVGDFWAGFVFALAAVTTSVDLRHRICVLIEQLSQGSVGCGVDRGCVPADLPTEASLCEPPG